MRYIITLQNDSFEDANVEMADRLPRNFLLIKNSMASAVRSRPTFSCFVVGVPAIGE